ncbi:MAG: hypothetical protein GX241_01105 [Ruminococcaceae bacterium]|nr:hypothetical protein [Oscillospiraceae bacterium]
MKNFKINKNIILHLAIILVLYLLCIFIKDTGSGMTLLLMIIPSGVAINSILYGLKLQKIDIIYVIACAVLFIPFVFIVLNESALIYSAIYSAIALLFNAIGTSISKK